jgi:hypothetical protein
MRVPIILLSVMLCGPLAAEQIYRYVDEQGNTVFTDEPRPGAEPVELGPINTVNTPAPEPRRAPATTDGPRQGSAYRVLRLTGPPDESVLRQQSGFSVALELEPSLQTREGHQSALFLNGEEYARGTQTSWQLQDLDRGSYAVQAAIIGPKGRRIASSNTLNVTIKRTSALQPRGPSVPGGAPSTGGASGSGAGAGASGGGAGSVTGPSSSGGAPSPGANP